MNASIARTYNELAAPALRRMGIEVVDTFSSGLRNPQMSADGVHFPGELSRQHAQAFLRAMCGSTPAVDPLLNNPSSADRFLSQASQSRSSPHEQAREQTPVFLSKNTL